MNKCPICGELNDDNWPLDVDGEIKDGGCQTCWEQQCDDSWWDAVVSMDRACSLLKGE